MKQAKNPRGQTTLRALLLGLGAAALLLGTILFALHQNAGPNRCAEGMIALGSRCCGQGQRLEDSHCKGEPTACAKGLERTPSGCVAKPKAIPIAEGNLILGPSDWEAQGQVKPVKAHLPAFAIDAYEVTEARYLVCVEAQACAAVTLSGEPGRPVTRVTLKEAQTFCRWAGGDVPTPEQLAFAAAGEKPRRYPWGDTGAVCRRAAFGLVQGPCAEGASGPEITGSRPDGNSPDAVADLAGNVAEWASPSASGPLAEARGGAFTDSAAAALRTWNRREIASATRATDIGFRCVYPLALASALASEGKALPR